MTIIKATTDDEQDQRPMNEHGVSDYKKRNTLAFLQPNEVESEKLSQSAILALATVPQSYRG